MNNRFGGRVALVTGAASGLGAAVARRLADEGALIYCADLPGAAGATMAEQVGGIHAPLDVTCEADWHRVVTQIENEAGGPDFLVNAAGIEGDVTAGTLEQTSLAEWRRVLAVNLDGTFLGCRAALPAIRRKGGGAIVNVASVASYYPTLQSVAYGASKGAVMQLTKTVAHEGGAKVRCNSVHPGMIRTPMLDSILGQLAERADSAAAERITESAARLPLGRFGTAEEVAGLITYLLSDDAGYATGGEYLVDGGWRLLR